MYTIYQHVHNNYAFITRLQVKNSNMGADVKYRQPLTRPVLGVRQLKQTGHDHLLKCWPTNEFHVDSLLRETNGVHPKNEARLLCGTKLTNSLQQITTQTRISAIMKPQSTIVTNVSC